MKRSYVINVQNPLNDRTPSPEDNYRGGVNNWTISIGSLPRETLPTL